jgi:adenylyltransferase/sulfurtransferase
VIGIGEDAAGKLHLLDGLGLSWRTMKLPKDPACTTCGKSA